MIKPNTKGDILENKLLRVSEDKLPIAKGTAFNWHSQKRHPRLIYKVAGVLMFDMEEWGEMAKRAQKENEEKVA